MTSCNEFTWPPVFTGSCLLFKMSFSCRSSPRAFYRFSPRAQSCSEYTMVWQDTSECLFKHLMRVKRIIRIRWWRSIKKIWFSLQLFITFFLGFQIRVRSTFRHMGKHLADSPHPLPFRAVLRSPQRNGGEPPRQATKRIIPRPKYVNQRTKGLCISPYLSLGESQERLSRGQGLLVKPALTLA